MVDPWSTYARSKTRGQCTAFADHDVFLTRGSDDKRRALIAKAAKLIAEDPAMKTYFERMK